MSDMKFLRCKDKSSGRAILINLDSVKEFFEVPAIANPDAKDSTLVFWKGTDGSIEIDHPFSAVSAAIRTMGASSSVVTIP
jgi:hypothetical protein